MVTKIINLGKNGVQEFILIRISAIILALYSLLLLGFFLTNDVEFQTWSAFFHNTGVKIFTILALIALLIHAWIGMWQVLTDYIKCAWLRGSIQVIIIIVACCYLITGIIIVSGV